MFMKSDYDANFVKIDRENLDSEISIPENEKNIFITGFSDGSHCPDTLAWGVGIWVRDGSNAVKKISFGGIGLRNSNEVERRGLQELTKYICQNCDIKNRVLIIQCDNINELRKIKMSSFSGVKHLKLKHVKGHTNHKTKRSQVNKIVDEMALREMKKYRRIALKQMTENQTEKLFQTA